MAFSTQPHRNPNHKPNNNNNNDNINNNNRTLGKRLYNLCPIILICGIFKFTTSFFLAKKSMPHISQCHPDYAADLLQNTLHLTLNDIQKMQGQGILSHYAATAATSTVGGTAFSDVTTASSDYSSKPLLVHGGGGGGATDGCWMPRRIDAMAIIVVDALRFDFALEHLPKSVGARLKKEEEKGQGQQQETNSNTAGGTTSAMNRGQSQLYKFVADPPTVTMQRLKGLTTGGLPTFADISGSFGGANVDEDSWLEQLHSTPLLQRGGRGRLGRRLQQNYMNDTIIHPSSQQDQNQQQKKEESETSVHAKVAFVGDDTWVDLFPNLFEDSHPYPSFNTRDLDTVDNGCLKHLPRLLESFGPPSLRGDASMTTTTTASQDSEQLEQPDYFEVIIAHFLGVDHVGHTYGPHNEHMYKKLNQVDEALETILSKVDSAPQTSCQASFVFGDHGMTEDGNHGGGTTYETNAALFTHYSPGCGDFTPMMGITGSEVGSHSEAAFQSINQIDLVPTISLLLGLPIPFANIGSVVPALLPPTQHHDESKEGHHNNDDHPSDMPVIAAALALNAAQVWNYLDTYSSSASKIPQEALMELKVMLDEAVAKYREALAQSDGRIDSFAYREACGLFKYFLSESLALGKRLWTRFDTIGMTIGAIMIGISFLFGFPWQIIQAYTKRPIRAGLFVPTWVKLEGIYQKLEPLIVQVFMIFQCIVLTFSNSYIVSEEQIILYSLVILGTLSTIYRGLIWYRYGNEMNQPQFKWTSCLPILIALFSRMNSMFVSGHGADPMIRKHGAHNIAIFLLSLSIIVIMRWYFATVDKSKFCKVHALLDTTGLLCLGFSWVEKRSEDISRHGYLTSRAALYICIFGFVLLLCETLLLPSRKNPKKNIEVEKATFLKVMLYVWKVLIFIVGVTGPSAAASAVFLIPQAWALSTLTVMSSGNQLQAPLVAALWRLSIRHAFFATGHACSFNRLQFSAAFVAVDEFYFIIAGVSLFLNTFGWEIIGQTCLAVLCKSRNCEHNIWNWFCFYQIMECMGSCISVSLMKRHLMVWAIFAPRFVFASIFSILCAVCWLCMVLFDKKVQVPPEHDD